MAFANTEASRDAGEPIELYFFKYGTGANAYHAYTDAEEEIIYDGVTYKPIPIDRGNITASGTLDKQKIEIRMPKTEALAEKFRVWPPSAPITFILRQGHYGDTEFLVVATGRVLSCAREGFTARFACEPIQTAMRRSGLRQNWQYGCPHVLYGPLCKASKAAARHDVVIASVDRTAISVVPGVINGATEYRFINGIVEWNGNDNRESRMILEIPQPGLYVLAGSTAGLVVGMQAEMYFGCAHDMTHCRLHNNILNYGGDPWIPFKNPVGVNPHW